MEMKTHSCILAWESYGQRSLGGYSPWGHEELDTTEHAFAHTHTHTHSRQEWTCDHILTKEKIIREKKLIAVLKVNGKFCFMNLVSSKVSTELLFSYLRFSTLSYLSKQILMKPL